MIDAMKFAIALIAMSLTFSALAAGHGSHEERLQVCFDKLKDAPGDLAARHELAMAYVDHGDWRLALAELRIVDRLRGPGSAPDCRLTRAMALVLAGRRDAALAELDGLLIQHPGHAAALLERARLYDALGQPGKSLADYRQTLASIAKPEPDLLLEIAEKLVAQRMNDEAVNILEKGIHRLGSAPALVTRLQRLGGSVSAEPTAAPSVATQANITADQAASSGALLRGPYLNQGNDRSIVVCWRSSEAVAGRVCYGDSPTNLTQVADEPTAATDHRVTLVGLAPHTRYYYSIGSAGDTLAAGADETFRTSPVPGTPEDTRIWVVGDCGRGSAAQKASRDAYADWTGSRTPDLCLMLGDNAYFSGTDAEYQTNFFDIYAEIFRKMPLWSTIGNHDANNEKIAARTTGTVSNFTNFPYCDIFTFPTAGECGGVPSGSERYFSFDYGNIHIVNLDSQTSDRRVAEVNGVDGAMAAWLRADLACTPQTWILAMFHHPIYSKGSNDSDTVQQMVQMRTNFGPLLEAGGVDLVLCGHSHAYERSFLMDGHYGHSSTFTEAMKKDPGNGRSAALGGIAPSGAYRKPLRGPRDHFGTVYTVAGNAGEAGGGPLNHPVMAVSLNTVGTFNLDIHGNTLVGTYVQSDGSAPDTFTLTKQGDADRDGDGISDAYEDANGLNRASSSDGGSADLDGDGVVNLNEYLLGTAANTPDQYQWTTSRDPLTGEITLSFPTLVGRTYRILCSADLLNWESGSALLTGDGSVMSWVDSGAVPQRFYRLEVVNNQD